MAVWYVYSGATGSGVGDNWTNAKTTLGAAATASGAGDSIYVANDHAESTAGAVTITFPGTAAAPSYVYCVNRAGSVPPVAADLATTATVSIGSNNNPILINGHCMIYGVIFQGATINGSNAHVGVAATQGNKQRFINCGFTIRTTNTGSFFLIGGTSSTGEAVFINCTITFYSTYVLMNGKAHFRNTSFVWSNSLSTYLLQVRTAGYAFMAIFEGCDLSNFSNTLINGASTNSGGTYCLVNECKLHASLVPLANTTTAAAPYVDIVRSDSGNTNYVMKRIHHMGTFGIDSTVYRTGGASDGVTPHSWKIIGNTNTNIGLPFECPPLRIWNDTVAGTITLTIYAVGSSVPYNDEFIVEAWVMENSSYPVSTKVTSEMTLLDTHAALTTDSGSTWNGFSTAPFSVALTLSPRQKGYINVYIRCAKNATFYVDPLPVLS